MQQKLVIVESPKKADLIQGFLKQQKLTGYKVMASAGHVRDLKQKSFSVDIENNYAPEYEISADKRNIVKDLKAEATKSELVYLASDEDREGEAIAWHLSEALNLKPEQRKRIVFHEITSEAFLAALDAPRDIDQNLVDAQQARRVLDRIVGFELSPVLWRRLKPSLSAGRVQSVAVRLIVEREREINAFVPESTFRVQAEFKIASGHKLKAELNHRFATEAEAVTFLEQCARSTFEVESITRKAARRSPAAPFTTSTLQQEASNRLGYSVSQTMRLAQSLYESGHITYMRTDSVNLSSLAMNTISKEISTKYGEQYLQPRRYQTKSKGAQEAHEAIRPTYVDRATIKGTAQEVKLYELIRRRAIASQMADALLERTTISIPVAGTPYAFVAQGEVVTFRGFLELYMEASGDEAKLLPQMSEGEHLEPLSIGADQRFTQRPARYTEASMVSKMEELGIGRPSTYAPTIQTIQARGYVERTDRPGIERNFIELKLSGNGVKRTVKTEVYGADKSKLIPTDTGLVVNDFLVEHFPNIVDFNFTARVEEEFDQIAEGDLVWQKVIDRFYKDFHPVVERASERNGNGNRVGARELGTDPATGLKVIASLGRYGSMIQIGTNEDEEKPRFASLQPGQSIETITLEEALDLFALPKQLGQFEDKVVTVAVGRFGPYIRHDGKFASLPKGMDPMCISLQEAIELIKAKREAEEKSLLRTFAEDAELEIRQGRFGPYIKYQGNNYKLPKDAVVDKLTYEAVAQIVAEAPAKTTKGKRTTAKAAAPKAKTAQSKAKSKAKA